MSTKHIQGTILSNGEWIRGEMIYDEKIISITGESVSAPDNSAPIIIPGFIDLHVHGAGGADVMDAQNSFEKISRTLAKHGTTSLLATTMTAEKKEIEKAIHDLKPYYHTRSLKSSRLLGIHLEGPFINEHKKGAHPEKMREATKSEILHLNSLVPIKIITIAPEIFHHLDLIQELQNLFTFQIGHTNATYEQTKSALNHGAKSFTHLFNAMSALHHREPGAVGAALLHAEFAELIPDLLHVHPAAIHLALKNIPKLYFVSDATAATGMPDGEYQLGSQRVEKCMGGVRLKDGTLAGSSLTMDVALRNLVSIGIDLKDVSYRLSGVPAKLIKAEDRGDLIKDHFADFIILDHNLHIHSVCIEGEMV